MTLSFSSEFQEFPTASRLPEYQTSNSIPPHYPAIVARGRLDAMPANTDGDVYDQAIDATATTLDVSYDPNQHTPAPLLSEEAVARIMHAYERFNQQPAIDRHTQDIGLLPNQGPNHWSNCLLTELSVYQSAAKAAKLTPQQAENLVTHTLNSMPFPEAARAYQTVARLGTTLTESSVDPSVPAPIEAIKSMITAAAKPTLNIAPEALDVFSANCQVGLSAEDSATMVCDYTELPHGTHARYETMALRDAVRALAIAPIPPELLQSTLEAIALVDKDQRKEAYDMLKDAIDRCPAMLATPTELLTSITEQTARDIDVCEVMEQIVEEGLPHRAQQTEDLSPQEQVDRFFIPRSGPLVHALLPYKTERSFNDGMRDIEALTYAQPHRGEVVSEGTWVFGDGMWYSMGGETTFRLGGATHSLRAYDLSSLTQTPHAIHIHPAALVAWPEDVFRFVVPSEQDFLAAAQLLDISRQLIDLTCYVAHPLGITECIVPNDSSKIKAMAGDYRKQAIRVQNMFSSSRHREQQKAANPETAYEHASNIIDEINRRLPSGFMLRLYAIGTDYEAIR